MKVYSIVSGGALLTTALLTCSLIFPSKTISAEARPSQAQAQQQPQTTPAIISNGNLGEKIASEEAYVVPPTSYVATAYSLR
ncbi:MAG TPA: hypothetical protein VGN10_00805, partial [Pyrinomonadaceae bacterium]